MTTTPPELEPPEQVLRFTLGEQRYCVSIERVEEIVRAETLTSLPESPPAVAGVMDLRGETTTILDPSRVFDTGSTRESQQVIIFGGDDRIGWLVDRVDQVRDLDDVAVDPAPESEYVSGLVSLEDGFILWVEPQTVNGAVSV